MKKKLDELTGKTETERIAEAVDKVLSGDRPQDEREIVRPLLHFLTVTFGSLEDEPESVARNVRDVIDDLQDTILTGRNGPMLRQVLAEESSEALEETSRIVNERLELVVVAPVVDRSERPSVAPS